MSAVIFYAIQVYVAAGTAYGLEAELNELEECARAVSSTTPDMEVSFLEERVASAAAKVHQSDLQVSSRWIHADLKPRIQTRACDITRAFFAPSRFPTSPPGSLL